MTALPNAPWITETEMFGLPPYEDNSDFEAETERQGKKLKKADSLTDQLVDLLLDAEDALLKFEKAEELTDEIREMIYKVENLGCDLRTLARKIEGR